MNGYNAQSDRIREARAMAARDQRHTRNGGYRPVPVRPTNATEASSGDMPPWKLKENGGADLTISLCLGGGSGHEHDGEHDDGDMEMMDPGDYYEAMRKMGRVPESALYPPRRFRETLEKMGEAEMTTRQRNRLPRTAFAIPEDRAYPINDLAHARNALARVSQFGSPEEQRRVRNAVYRKFPQLNPDKKK